MCYITEFTPILPNANSPLSDFVRNASQRERERVYANAIEESIRYQQEIVSNEGNRDIGDDQGVDMFDYISNSR